MKNRNITSTFATVSLALACFALSPQARAVCQEACLTNSNTVLGDDALFSLTTAIGSTAIGYQALFHDTSGTDNTATGRLALHENTTGFFNTAIGSQALHDNTTGHSNAATGGFALFNNTTGFQNTASGRNALLFNETGDNNIATGAFALQNNTTGDNNIAVGASAGINLTTGSNNIDIGNAGVAAESGRIRIGTSGTQTATFIAGINGAAIGAGIPVRVSISGQLGTQASSARFKEAIKPMDKASEAILALKPVTFRYKEEIDPDRTPEFGLVAEEVEKVNPDLVVRDAKGKSSACAMTRWTRCCSTSF
jgi:hypothetical protein